MILIHLTRRLVKGNHEERDYFEDILVYIEKKYLKFSIF